MAGKFELRVGVSGQFSFVLKAANGQVILVSEQYKSKASAKNGIASVQRNGTDDGRFQRKVSKRGKPYFVLIATNGQVIGQSEEYSSDAALENGIASVKKHVVDCKIEEI
ncbi:MAG TPA: YegP family protein [Thermoanaerobaculaceae bacterium]|nr:YegP family protein [Thermoanaerobaculaceae bacterium]